MHVYLQLTVLKELSLVKKGKFCGELNFCTNLKKNQHVEHFYHILWDCH